MHRLLGAAVIILAGIVLLPMIFGNGKIADQQSNEHTQLEDVQTADDTQIFVSTVTLLSGKTPVREPEIKPLNPTLDSVAVSKQPKAGLIGVDEVPIAVLSSKSSRTLVKLAPAETAKPKLKSVKAKQKPTAIDRGWVVRVGTFSVAENASNVIAKLKSKGFDPSSEKIKSQKDGKVTRVWVGPYATRVEAARVRSRVERSIGEKSFIASYP